MQGLHMNKANRVKTMLARFSAFVFMIILIWGCGRVPRTTEVPNPVSRLPFVKVLLDDSAARHTIGSVDNGEIAIDCFKGDKRVSYYSRKPVIVQAEDRRLGLYMHDGSNLDYNLDRIVISPRGKKRLLTCDDKTFRGLMEVYSTNGQVKLVNVVYVEDYLRGVVPLEIGPTPKEQEEAIKAQAVAARTYAMAHLGQYGVDAEYDLKSDISDQVYGGVSTENDLTSRAIDATRGEVAVYRDRMINAYYHSTCGGMTDDIEDVWDKDAAPYLVSVSDNHACDISKYYRWTERFTGEQIIYRLEQHLSRERGDRLNLGKLKDIYITGRTPGGRVASITFVTTGGQYSFHKEKVRWVVGRSDNSDGILRSANFDLELQRDRDSVVTLVTFNGRGYGHGVGMCQMGARGMAQNGIAYDSILRTYYQGTMLKKLY